MSFATSKKIDKKELAAIRSTLIENGYAECMIHFRNKRDKSTHKEVTRSCNSYFRPIPD